MRVDQSDEHFVQTPRPRFRRFCVQDVIWFNILAFLQFYHTGQQITKQRRVEATNFRKESYDCLVNESLGQLSILSWPLHTEANHDFCDSAIACISKRSWIVETRATLRYNAKRERSPSSEKLYQEDAAKG